jgi:hypothetical protein
LAARFGNLPPEQFDEAVRDAQRRILEALDLDRSAVFQSANGTDLVMTHHWAREGLPAILPAVSAASEFPWSLQKIRSGEMAYFSAVEEVPTPRARGPHSWQLPRVACPLSIDGRKVADWFSPTVWPDLPPANIVACPGGGGVQRGLARKQADSGMHERAAVRTLPTRCRDDP